MNNKTIIEFGFRRIQRILQILEGVIHLGLQPQWITPFLICRILHILRKPNLIIAKYFSVSNIKIMPLFIYLFILFYFRNDMHRFPWSWIYVKPVS